MTDDTETQQVIVKIDVTPGPFIDAVGERLLHLLTDELLKLGMDVTRTRLELRGRISSW